MSRYAVVFAITFGLMLLAIPTSSLPQGVQLLVDDHIVDSKVGLTRVVQQPRRHFRNPIIEAEHEWEGSVLEMPTVFWDPHLKIYRMYYWAIYDSETIYTCYAESRNSINWKKPVLGLHQGPDGTTSNSIVLRGEGKVARTRYVVLNPDTSDRQRRYLALYIDNVPGLTEFAASSPDGFHWITEKKIGNLRQVRGGPVSDKLHFYYCGFQQDHASTQNSASLGLALFLDQFGNTRQTAPYLFGIMIFWLGCGFVCGLVGRNKEAGTEGWFMGLLMGRIGFIGAFALDKRPSCPHCGSRLNGRPAMCPACRFTFEWTGDECTYFPPSS